MNPNSGCRCEVENHPGRLVVLTGGPGAGKTAVLELARRNFCKHTIVLPEAASIIFGGGFLRRDTSFGKKCAQRAIFHVQDQLEKIAIEEQASGLILCDRGTLDGLAYWPDNEEVFWEDLNSTLEAELSKYALVIHLRTPPGNRGYNRSNPVRTESAEEAAQIDERILRAWEGHPNRVIIESSLEFLEKASRAMAVIRNQLPECCRNHNSFEFEGQAK